ncbi:hypothetical protein GOBAR_DD30863 [Gossypium barbadense]|nr:hypothetical protein GOBAR_DD30863 [Gossypium barbadense]
MLGVLCARPPKPWILNSLSLIAHGGSAAHHHENRLLHWPSHFADLSAANRRCRHHSTACRLGGGSEGGAASIWHAILPCGGDRGVKNRGDVWKNVERKGEGSWNVSWDARPARWLRPDSAWLLFGVCACLAPMPMDEFDDVNLDADNKTDASLNSDEKSSNHLSSVVNELLKRREETEWFIEGDFDAYVKEIQQPYVWGGEPELLMASHVLKTRISVYMIHRSSGNLINIAKYGEEYQKEKENPINVLFHGYGHYDILESLPELISTK